MSLAGVGWPKHRRDTAAAGAGIAAGSRGKGNRHRLMRRLLTLQSRDAIRHTFASNGTTRGYETRYGATFEIARYSAGVLGSRMHPARSKIPASITPANTHSKR